MTELVWLNFLRASEHILKYQPYLTILFQGNESIFTQNSTQIICRNCVHNC